MYSNLTLEQKYISGFKKWLNNLKKEYGNASIFQDYIFNIIHNWLLSRILGGTTTCKRVFSKILKSFKERKGFYMQRR